MADRYRVQQPRANILQDIQQLALTETSQYVEDLNKRFPGALLTYSYRIQLAWQIQFTGDTQNHKMNSE